MSNQVTSNAPLPFVSVILPVLNGAGRLEHALTALRRQDYPEECFEIIVADGRSRDATAKIAESFGCKVVDNPGITVAAGRNAGVRHARGDLIAFSEDDIVLPPHWLSSAVRLLTESGAAGVGGPTPIPKSSSLWSHAVNAVFRAASARGASVQSDHAATGSVDDLPGGNSIYAAETLRAVGPIDETLTTAEDVAMHHELRRRGLELRLSGELAAEHHKRDSVLGFFGQIQRFAMGRVQLFRRWRGALSPLHWCVAGAGPLALILLLALFSATSGDPSLLALLGLGTFLSSVLVALRQGERFPVALLFPIAITVFVVGWSSGFWSELILPSRKPTQTRLADKMADAYRDAPLARARWLRWLLGSILLIKVGLLCVFSQRATFAMDEFQQGGYARHIETGYYSAVVPFKTVLFTYPYYLPRLWLEKASAILLCQRLETVGAVLATLLMLYAISRRLGRTKLEALLVVAVALSFSTFFERSTNLRAEPWALLLATVALYAAVAAPERDPRWHYLGCGVALGGAFFCTQKAIWFCVSIAAGAFGKSWLSRHTRARATTAATLAQAVWLPCGFAVVALGYCFAFPPATPLQVFRGVFVRSSRFATAANDVYGDLTGFVSQSLQQNWWLYALCGAGFLLGAARLRRDSKLLACWLTTLFMSLFILTWKEPWPYVLTWWIPFLALFAPDLLLVSSHAVRCHRATPWAERGPAAAILVALALTFPRNLDALTWDNREQLEVVDRVERLLAPGEYYQDGIGMVSTRELSGLTWWDAPAIARILAAHKQGGTEELERAFRQAPKVLIMNYRLGRLLPALAPFVVQSYTPVDRGLLIAGTWLAEGRAAQFHARWAGSYALVRDDGSRASGRWHLDGTEIVGAAWISAGLHQVSAPGCTSCFLVPDDVVGQVIPSTTLSSAALFDGIYTR